MDRGNVFVMRGGVATVEDQDGIYVEMPSPWATRIPPPPPPRVRYVRWQEPELSDDELKELDEQLTAAKAEHEELLASRRLVESLKAQLLLESQSTAFYEEALASERAAHDLCRQEGASYRASLADAYATIAKLAGKSGSKFGGLVGGALLTVGALLGAAVSN